MIQAQQVQDRRVEIVDGEHILGGREAEVVGCPVTEGGLDSGTGQPAGESSRVVVSSQRSSLEPVSYTHLTLPTKA